MPPAPSSAARQRTRTPPRPKPTPGKSRRRDAPGPEPASRPAPDQPAASRARPAIAKCRGGPGHPRWQHASTRDERHPRDRPDQPHRPRPQNHLRALKLGRLLDILPERLTLARQQNMTHADFPELVLADEVSRRESGSAALRARAAGLDPAMHLEAWDATASIRYDQQLWKDRKST